MNEESEDPKCSELSVSSFYSRHSTIAFAGTEYFAVTVFAKTDMCSLRFCHLQFEKTQIEKKKIWLAFLVFWRIRVTIYKFLRLTANCN